MKLKLTGIISMLIFLLTGCSQLGNRTANISIIYGIAAVLSLLILIGYCSFVAQKEVWFLLLFASVFIVNTGYLTVSISTTLEEALLANRISYLGSVFLPMCMLMIIINVTKISVSRWIPTILFLISACVFLIAASPGYLDLYYKEVDLVIINGVSTLDKTYGPWHCIYLYYLVTYFSVMLLTILYAAARKKLDSFVYAVLLLLAVFVNIGIWFIEQLIKLNFETLSLSYIISELFLFGLNLIMQENARLREIVPVPVSVMQNNLPEVPSAAETEEVNHVTEEITEPEKYPEELLEQFQAGMAELTPTERKIYNYYVDGKTTKEILLLLEIKENTLKFHNKNLYGKLGVSSRKQLIKFHQLLENEN